MFPWKGYSRQRRFLHLSVISAVVNESDLDQQFFGSAPQPGADRTHPDRDLALNGTWPSFQCEEFTNLALTTSSGYRGGLLRHLLGWRYRSLSATDLHHRERLPVLRIAHAHVPVKVAAASVQEDIHRAAAVSASLPTGFTHSRRTA